jgi:hypothetical protein
MRLEGKDLGVTQSDVTASTGGSETATPTRSSRAERNAASAADLDRSRGGFAANPASAVQLAEVEEVDPSTVFQRDGAGFPDWLSANLDRLAKELGVSGLREVGRDVGVGSFTADLLAQTDRGRRVAIMSHLEPSDHLHLGPLFRGRAAPAAHRRLPARRLLPRRGPPQRLAEGHQAAPTGRLAAQHPHAGVLSPTWAAGPGPG